MHEVRHGNFSATISDKATAVELQETLESGFIWTCHHCGGLIYYHYSVYELVGKLEAEGIMVGWCDSRIVSSEPFPGVIIKEVCCPLCDGRFHRGAWVNADLDEDSVDEGLRHVGAVADMDSLDLRGARLSGMGFAHIGNLNQLQSLDLTESSVQNDHLMHLKGLKNIRYLSLSSTRVSDSGLEHLATCHQLVELSLDRTNINGERLCFLWALTELEFLNLSGTSIQDAHVEYLGRLTNLKILAFYGTRVTEAGRKALAEALPDCHIQS